MRTEESYQVTCELKALQQRIEALAADASQSGREPGNEERELLQSLAAERDELIGRLVFHCY